MRLAFAIVTLLHADRSTAPYAGAGRFTTLVKQLRPAPSAAFTPALVAFSGDALSPSSISSVTHGAHMAPILNLVGVDIAMAGNHDFDFGEEPLTDVVKASKFPWLLSNCVHKNSTDILAGCKRTHVVEHQGYKIGFMGLIEEDWLQTLATLEPDDLQYVDFIDAGRAIAKELRLRHGVDIVVALTHMRLPNDQKLARAVDDIDIILGGHDHSYAAQMLNGVAIIKSGSDFEHLTELEIMLREQPLAKDAPAPADVVERVEDNAGLKELAGEFHCRRVRVKSTLRACEQRHTPDPEVERVVHEYGDEVLKKLDSKIGSTRTPLDCRFSRIRTKETSVGNFVADLMRASVRADVAILNSGTLRADCVIEAGDITLRDLQKLLPQDKAICKVRLSGAELLAALENGVSQYPKLEGRFPQVSGMVFEFDATKPAGARIIPGSVHLLKAMTVEDGTAILSAAANKRGEKLAAGLKGGGVQLHALDLNAHYTVAISEYLMHGKDGYDTLKVTRDKVQVDEHHGPILPHVVGNHFRALAVLNKADSGASSPAAAGAAKLLVRLGSRGSMEASGAAYAIAPREEGRIRVVDGEIEYPDMTVWEKKDKLRILKAQAEASKSDMAAAVQARFASAAAESKAEAGEEEEGAGPPGGAAAARAKAEATARVHGLRALMSDGVAVHALPEGEKASDWQGEADERHQDVSKLDDDIKTHKASAAQAAADAAKQANIAGAEAADNARSSVKAGQDLVQDLFAQANEATSQAKSKASAGAAAARDTAESKAADARESAESKAADARETAESKAADARESAESKAAAAKGQATSAAEEAEQRQAAVRIQAAARGRKARQEVGAARASAAAKGTAAKTSLENKKEEMEAEQQRNEEARKAQQAEDDAAAAKAAEEREQALAATRIQAATRGKAARRAYRAMRE